MKEVEQLFLHDKDIVVEVDKDLTTYTTMRLRATGTLISVKNVKALQKCVKTLSQEKIKYRVIGWGANQLIPTIKDWVYLQLNFELGRELLQADQDEYTLPADLSLNLLTSSALKFGHVGWEVFTGIPATLGGAIFMNAGTNLGEIGSLISNVKFVNHKGEIQEHVVTNKSFSYRRCNFINEGDVIFEATILRKGKNEEEIPPKIKNYLAYRKNTQPLNTHNCGCVFKNYSPAFPSGKLIDVLGLKGLEINGLKISEKHSNFFEHSGNATFDDFLLLQKIIKAEIERYTGIEIELEVKF